MRIEGKRLKRARLIQAAKKGTGPICAQHPPGRSGKLDLSPFSSQGEAATSLWPIAITGWREPLQIAILRGLRESLSAYHRKPGTKKRPADLLRDVTRQLHHATNGKPPTARQLTELLAETLETVCEGSSGVDGLFLIIDELGKLLEFAATHPSSSDVYLLQAIAEFAVRAPHPFLVLGILQQDFGVYADRLSSKECAEWDKVRGRFEDSVFDEPADEILRLVAQARSTQTRSASEGSGIEDAGSPRSRVGLVSARDKKSFRSLCEAAWELELAHV